MSDKAVIALLVCMLVLIACRNESKQTVATDSMNFHVELLFEVDDCKVYRFQDAGSTHYFTSCQGSVSNTDKHGEHRIETVVTDTTAEDGSKLY